MVMAELKLLHPEWADVPYQVKRTSVRDACRAMSNVKTFNQQLAEDQRSRTRLDEEFATLNFRSRKNPRQSCYIPDDAVTEHGVYHTVLGSLRMAEAIPAGQKECRLVKERGLYWLVVPHQVQCDIETLAAERNRQTVTCINGEIGLVFQERRADYRRNDAGSRCCGPGRWRARESRSGIP